MNQLRLNSVSTVLISCVALLVPLSGAAQLAGDIPPSHWLEAEKRRAMDLLDGQDYDILVVPFQTEGYPFDATARSLMTMSLATRLHLGSDLKVADPVWIARAFGKNGRSYSDAEIARIATHVGAERVVIGVTGHDQNGNMVIRVVIREVSTDQTLATGETEVFRETGIPFDDEKLPYFAFLGRRDEIASQIEPELRVVKQDDGTSINTSFPPLLEDFELLDQESFAAAARYLQLIGSLHPPYTYDRITNLVFERSLVLMEYVEEDAPDYNVLIAGPLIYSNRRPAAMAILADAETAEEKALLGLLNGSLPPLAESLPEIDDPLYATIVDLNFEYLNMLYGAAADTEKAASYFDVDEVWGPLLYGAFARLHRFAPYTQMPLKLSLDAAVPDEKLTLESYLLRKSVTGEAPDEYEVTQLVLQHLEAVDFAVDECAIMLPCRSDYLDLVRDMLVGSIIDQMAFRLDTIGKSDSALSFIDEYEALLAGHPAATLGLSRALLIRGNELRGQRQEQGSLLQRSRELRRHVLAWSNRQTYATARLADGIGNDYFERGNASPDERHHITFETDWPSPPIILHNIRSQEDRLAMYRHCLDYTLTDIQCLTEFHTSMGFRASTRDMADDLITENTHRFIGHPQRVEYLARQLLRAGDQDGADAMYQAEIDAGSTQWAPYNGLAIRKALSSEFGAALEVALKYPGFNEEGVAERVAISNYAYELGSHLYWAGAYEQARPLYEIAASTRTGSAADISSSVRLALMDGDYDMAIQETIRRVRRYDTKYGWRDLIGLFVITGQPDAVSAVVDSVQPKLNEPEIWSGVLIAQRSNDMTLDEMADWAFAEGRASINGQNGELALRHLFLAATMDRIPTESLPGLLQEHDPRPAIVHVGEGLVTWRGRGESRSTGFAGRDAAVADADQFPPNEEIDRPLVAAAKALTALYADDFTTAFELLDAGSHFYDITEFLPQYAWAAAKVGDTDRLERYLTTVEQTRSRPSSRPGRNERGRLFDVYLSQAVLSGLRGDHDDAIDRLQRANSDIRHNERRPIFTRYQIMETARLLYEDTRNPRYREFALDLARRNTIIEPIQSYTHSFVAMLSAERNERVTALARILVLDPQSRCLDVARTDELEEARRISESGYPMPGQREEAGI